jgi:hypothetical protein
MRPAINGSLRLAVIAAILCVIANTTCWAQCQVSACNQAGQQNPEDNACHQSRPTAPGHQQRRCEHPQLVTDDWQQFDWHGNSPHALYVPLNIAVLDHCCDVPESARVSRVGSPPGSALLATPSCSILRI